MWLQWRKVVIEQSIKGCSPNVPSPGRGVRKSRFALCTLQCVTEIGTGFL